MAVEVLNLEEDADAYTRRTVPRDIEGMSKEIRELARARNAVILAHNYQVPEVQDVADYVGDSLGLSRQAAATPSDLIVFCGVHFMAETAVILSPKKRVLIPDLAEYHLAYAVAERFREAVERFDRHVRRGPPGARVSHVQVDAAVPARRETGFSIR